MLMDGCVGALMDGCVDGRVRACVDGRVRGPHAASVDGKASWHRSSHTLGLVFRHPSSKPCCN